MYAAITCIALTPNLFADYGQKTESVCKYREESYQKILKANICFVDTSTTNCLPQGLLGLLYDSDWTASGAYVLLPLWSLQNVLQCLDFYGSYCTSSMGKERTFVDILAFLSSCYPEKDLKAAETSKTCFLPILIVQ